MANNYGISDAELNLIKQQAARRVTMRQEFQKQRSNPWKGEAGYVFDPALQRFLSMKVSQFEFFQANRRTSLFGVCALVIPMAAYGYLIWTDRTTREAKIRSGELKYKDRLFKFHYIIPPPSYGFIMAYNDGYGFSELECKIIRAQIERRAKFRQEFLKMRSHPCPHDAFVFDPAVQRFLSMKISGLDFFQANANTVKFGIFAILLPMASYGYLIWSTRTQLERDIRCGKVKYRDRIHKFR